MGSGERWLDEIAAIEFRGKVPKQVAAYAKANQRFAHDLARELDAAETAADAAMRQLKGHPLLAGVDVAVRAWRVSRHLREARELVQGISAEAVKFNIQFRNEFLSDTTTSPRATKKSSYKGEVDL